MFSSGDFQEMDTYYQSPGSHGIEVGWGETDFIVSFNYENTEKTVRAFGYLTPIGSIPPAELPNPLNEIHAKLMDIAENRTEEVCRGSF